MSKLQTYLHQTGVSGVAFARRIGVAPSHLYEMMHFKKVPSLALAYRIERATDGLVPMQSFIEDAPEGTPARARLVSPKATSCQPGKEISHG